MIPYSRIPCFTRLVQDRLYHNTLYCILRFTLSNRWQHVLCVDTFAWSWQYTRCAHMHKYLCRCVCVCVHIHILQHIIRIHMYKHTRISFSIFHPNLFLRIVVHPGRPSRFAQRPGVIVRRVVGQDMPAARVPQLCAKRRAAWLRKRPAIELCGWT